MIDLNLKKKIFLSLKYPRTAKHFLEDRFLFKGKTAEFPRIINCFVTEKCNFNCPMCHIKESRLRSLKNLSFDVLEKVIWESEKFSPSFQLTGGEPLLHKDLAKMIRSLTQKKMVKGIVTNGLLLEEKAKELIDSGLDFLAVSIDGPDENTQYKRGFVKGSFDKAVEGIKQVIKLRGKRLFPNIRIATVISETNLNNFDEILAVADDLGVDQWSLSHFFYFPEEILERQSIFAEKYKLGREVWGKNIGRKKELFGEEERKIIAEKIKTIKEKSRLGGKNIRITFQPDLDIDKYYTGAFPSKKSVCTSPDTQVFIRGNGDVEMCQGYILGNIKEDSLYNIWHGDKARNFREVFDKVGVMPACFRCCALDIKFD